MISASALIGKFKYALDNQWGYIWGTAGDLWTESKQKQKINYMVSKYGTNWKNNSEAKDDNYYGAAVYGSKWVGHYVADCSGMFRWAFNQFKEYIAHGSNTIFHSYCTSTGSLSGGKRMDGKELKPGTAVFVYNKSKNNYSHIGLYIGGGKVIEASGTQAGVCVSNASASKWTYWGELKNVSYTGEDQGFPSETTWRPTIRRGSKGQEVIQMQTMLYKLGYDIGVDGIDGDFGRNTERALKEFQSDHSKTDKLVVDGVCGPMTWDALQKAYDTMSGTPKEPRYTVCIHGLDKTQAEALRNNYPGSIVTEE